MPPAGNVVARLTGDQRDALGRLLRTGSRPAAMRRRAAILLKADADGPDAWTDGEIADHPEATRITAQRVRQPFAAEGLGATLHRERPTGRQYRKPGGGREARLIALAGSKAPDGHARWAMKLLADKPAESEVVESIDPATVRRALQRTTSSRGSSSSGSSRRGRAGRSSRQWRTWSRCTTGRPTRAARWRAWARAASN